MTIAEEARELIRVERERQVAKEGFTEAHDDFHFNRELAQAAGCYALVAGGCDAENTAARHWPVNWCSSGFKPEGGQKRNLVKAAALLQAELERVIREERALA